MFKNVNLTTPFCRSFGLSTSSNIFQFEDPKLLYISIWRPHFVLIRKRSEKQSVVPSKTSVYSKHTHTHAVWRMKSSSVSVFHFAQIWIPRFKTTTRNHPWSYFSFWLHIFQQASRKTRPPLLLGANLSYQKLTNVFERKIRKKNPWVQTKPTSEPRKKTNCFPL